MVSTAAGNRGAKAFVAFYATFGHVANE